jgi:hypothetical protein
VSTCSVLVQVTARVTADSKAGMAIAVLWDETRGVLCTVPATDSGRVLLIFPNLGLREFGCPGRLPCKHT